MHEHGRVSEQLLSCCFACHAFVSAVGVPAYPFCALYLPGVRLTNQSRRVPAAAAPGAP